MDQSTEFTLAYCQNCGGWWSVITTQPLHVLEGTCMDCQQQSDSEKPLTFARIYGADPMLEPLPEGWLL